MQDLESFNKSKLVSGSSETQRDCRKTDVLNAKLNLKQHTSETPSGPL